MNFFWALHTQTHTHLIFWFFVVAVNLNLNRNILKNTTARKRTLGVLSRMALAHIFKLFLSIHHKMFIE